MKLNPALPNAKPESEHECVQKLKYSPTHLRLTATITKSEICALQHFA